MESWAWLGVYLVGFALLQIYLYFYFIRGEQPPAESRAEGTPSGPSELSPTPVDRPDISEDDTLRGCHTCGTSNRNDPMFVYCKRCGDRLD